MNELATIELHRKKKYISYFIFLLQPSVTSVSTSLGGAGSPGGDCCLHHRKKRIRTRSPPKKFK
jgi:hypothetical protein